MNDFGDEEAEVADAGPKDIAGAILAFEELYNERLAPLFTPIRGEGLVLTRSQVKAMFILLGRPGQTATELGEAMRMTKASLTGILDALEAEGLVQRSGDRSDRRRSPVSLTAAGRKACERKARELDAKLESLFAPLAPAERADFVRHLLGATGILGKLED
jgi:DNA-binding MarR family transcriptional regulator